MRKKLNFRQWRMAFEITQQEMADFIGVHVNTYINYENNPNSIPISKAILICKKLDIDMEDVIFCPETLQNVD